MAPAAAIFKNPNRDHIFLVIGAPRSGTTLLATMIARHSDVAMINEDITGRGFRSLLGGSVIGNKLCVPNQIQLKRKSFLGSRFLGKIGIITESPRSKYSIADYISLPNLKIVAIIRDGNDSILSMISRGKSRLKKAARRWGEAIETIYEIKNAYEERILIVSFEDLVLNPKANMERVAAFLKINYEDRMLDGPRYNPFYREQEFKKDRIDRARNKGFDYKIADRSPLIYRKYEELIAFSKLRPAYDEDGALLY